jgi:hypothetical protein
VKASLRVAHSRSCPNYGKTTLASAPTSRSRNGCTCRPACYTLHRQQVGNDRHTPVKGERVHDRRTTEAELERLQRARDQGRLDQVKPKSISLPEWISEYDQSASGAGGRAATRRVVANLRHPPGLARG